MSVLYPIFIICASICENSVWKSVFYDLSKGITPTDITISNEKIEGKYNTINYRELNEYELCDAIIDMYTAQKVKIKDDDTFLHEKWEENNWKNIRKKKIRESLIENYVSYMGDEMEDADRNGFLARIKIAFIYGDINSDDITMCDGQISSIDGVDFENQTIKKKTGVIKAETSNKKENLLSYKWALYSKKISKNPLLVSLKN